VLDPSSGASNMVEESNVTAPGYATTAHQDGRKR
jgi:hypothetical protein